MVPRLAGASQKSEWIQPNDEDHAQVKSVCIIPYKPRVEKNPLFKKAQSGGFCFWGF